MLLVREHGMGDLTGKCKAAEETLETLAPPQNLCYTLTR